MIKKKLQSMPELPATPQMIETACQDRGTYRKLYKWQNNITHVYDHDLYFRALVKDGILKVALFVRKQLVLGDTVPKFEIYIDKAAEQYLTWIPGQQRWSEARLGYLDDNRWNCAGDDWEEPGARKTVNDYLQNGEIRIYNAIDKFQSCLKATKLTRAHQSEKDKIDAAMKLVPDLPKDWESWLCRSAYTENMYLLYHPGEDRAYCTACGKETTRIDVRHRERTKCPHCRHKVTALSWNKQKTLTDNKTVGILQKLKDGSGYCLSVYGSKIFRSRETDWKVSESNSGWWKLYRFFLNKNLRNVTCIYEWDDFKATGEIRWCYQIRRDTWYYSGPTSHCVLYHRNLKKLRKGTNLKYVPLEELYANCQGWYATILDQLFAFRQQPGLEYLIKAGLYKLAWDLSDRGAPGNRTVDWKQKKIWKALRISKDKLSLCREMNISENELKTLQKAEAAGLSLTKEEIRFYSREFGAENVTDIWRYGHIGKTKTYMEKNRIRAVDYTDYIQELKKLRISPTEDVLYPKNFQVAHERTSQQVREKEEALEKQKLKEKETVLKAMLPELSEIYLGTKADDFQMVIPACKEDFNREGRENHNCVGGSYFDKMIKGDSVILFLRRKEEPDKAFCTIEMVGSRVKQCRAIRNSEPPAEVTEFMEKYSREIEKRLARKAKQATTGVAG